MLDDSNLEGISNSELFSLPIHVLAKIFSLLYSNAKLELGHVSISKILLRPAAYTGIHKHDSLIIGFITKGKLTHRSPSHEGGVRILSVGETIVEEPGIIHSGCNETMEDVEIIAFKLM